MGLNPELLKQLVEMFKTELEEKLQMITNGLIVLEKSGQKGEEGEKTIGNIFRAAHNIKGTSRSLGIVEVGNIAHQIESLFSSIQQKEIAVSSAHIDLCLEAVDKMRSAMQSFVDKKPLDFDMQDFLARLETGQAEKHKTTHVKPVASNIKKTEKKLSVAPEPGVEINKQNSIRVSINNIDNISALMEEMQVNKIAIDDHYMEFKKLGLKIKQFQDIWQQIRNLMKGQSENLVGEILQKVYLLGEDSITDIISLSDHMHKDMRSRINELSLLSNSLQEEIRTMRLVPVSNLLCTMPRYLRDLSHELNKKVELKIVGDEVKMDKMVLEKLKDPIIHILRNSVDHGIESPDVRKAEGKSEFGEINIDIKEKNNQILIRITDDGGGIDTNKIVEIAEKKNLASRAEIEKMSEREKLELIFYPGFSVKELITSISGRGIGLDVVKVNLGSVNGHVDVSTELGKGTTFELYVPLTLASERGLMIKSGGQLFVIPASAVQRVLLIQRDTILKVEGSQVIMLDEHPILLYTLQNILGFEENKLPTMDQLPIVVIKNDRNSVALLVDEIIGEREIVIKPLHAPLVNVPCVAGGTLSGSNQVIIVFNPNDLINTVLHLGKSRSINIENEASKAISRPHILVVDDSITTRSLEKNILESQNYQVTVAVNGKEAWDYLQKQKFSLLITDITMPIMDGFTLTERVKQSDELHNLPVIIVTSLGSEAEKKRGIEVGANAYIVKSEFESAALLEIVSQLV